MSTDDVSNQLKICRFTSHWCLGWPFLRHDSQWYAKIALGNYLHKLEQKKYCCKLSKELIAGYKFKFCFNVYIFATQSWRVNEDFDIYQPQSNWSNSRHSLINFKGLQPTG